MQLKRCGKGHFYDGDKFLECPHCAESSGGQRLQRSACQEEDSVTVPVSAYQKEDSVTVPVSAYQEDSVTVPVSAYQEEDSVTVPVSAYQEEDSVTVPVSAYMEQGSAPLRKAVQMAVGQVPDEDDGKTVSIYQSRGHIIDPVVGWMVCIEGQDFGSSFILKSGRNFVGRSADMDIVLHGDNSISRVKHAIILYEPRRREFIAQAGESRELFYVNEEVVLNPIRLRQHDILTIGNTKLMFFPCCGENFSWDDYKKDRT